MDGPVRETDASDQIDPVAFQRRAQLDRTGRIGRSGEYPFPGQPDVVGEVGDPFVCPANVPALPNRGQQGEVEPPERHVERQILAAEQPEHASSGVDDRPALGPDVVQPPVLSRRTLSAGKCDRVVRPPEQVAGQRVGRPVAVVEVVPAVPDEY